MRRETLPAGKLNRSEGGFAYAVLLAAIVIMGIGAQIASTSNYHRMVADREAELLFRGDQFRKAIHSYYQSGQPVKYFPKSLDDLVDDPRLVLRRHIRELYQDPITGSEWLLIRDADGGIRGVASASHEAPRKQAGFPRDYQAFEGAGSYRDWVFEYIPEDR